MGEDISWCHLRGKRERTGENQDRYCTRKMESKTNGINILAWNYTFHPPVPFQNYLSSFSAHSSPFSFALFKRAKWFASLLNRSAVRGRIDHWTCWRDYCTLENQALNGCQLTLSPSRFSPSNRLTQALRPSDNPTSWTFRPCDISTSKKINCLSHPKPFRPTQHK